MTVYIKTAQEIEKMRIAGRLASEVLDYITPFVDVGITTEELDTLCHHYMVDVQKTIPAPLNYAPSGHSPYPKSICTSVNNQICHGVPGQKKLKNGDIINIDITVIYQGYHGDTSRMFYVGEPSIQAKRLCEVTYEAMWKGIDQIKPGKHLGDIGHAIQKLTEGKAAIRHLPDGWTVTTKDGSLSAQWEHTVLVTEDGYEVLTVSTGSPAKPVYRYAA